MADFLSIICPPQRSPFNQPRGEEPFDRDKEIFSRLWWLFFNAIANLLNKPLVRVGLRADRLALDPASVLPGTLFTETDTGLVYQVFIIAKVPTWRYVSGVYALLQADIEAFSDTLTTDDTGALFDTTDYLHQYRWDGAALNFAPGDGSEYILSGSPRGGPPLGGLWGLCNGSAYDVAQPDGTVFNVTTSDFTGDVTIMGAGSPDAAQRVASRIKWEAGAKTDTEDATHTHTVTITDALAYGAGGFGAAPGQTVGSSVESVTHKHNLTDALSQSLVLGEGQGSPLRIATTWYIRR